MALRETVLWAALEQFLTTGLDDVLARPVPGEAEQRALVLFTSVVATVPAYRAFLAEHDVDPAAVRTIDDFRTLPLPRAAAGPWQPRAT
jgi:phenylacetate-CoA ligase